MQVFLVFRGKCVAAIHHQWLYGQTAPRRLLRLLAYLQDYRVLRVIEHGDAYAPMTAAYCVDTEIGYAYTRNVCREPVLLDDPCGGDNNDGITVVSLLASVPNTASWRWRTTSLVNRASSDALR